MGMVVQGRWTPQDPAIVQGHFIRMPSIHAGPLDGVAKQLRAQAGRYHLIASASCPWSHRTLIVHALKGLHDHVPVQIAGGERSEGYPIHGGRAWTVPGAKVRIRHLHQLYTLDDPAYTGRATVPVLWDSARCRILSNESARIMRALNGADQDAPDAFTLVPPGLAPRIQALAARLHAGLCNAVYQAGLAQCQEAYDEAVGRVFDTLQSLERRLRHRRYLFGQTLTECDWQLYPTLVRFDAVYHAHFKCARQRLVDLPHLWAYARDLHTWRGVAETVDFAAISHGYHRHDRAINPFGIVPVPFQAEWSQPHGREHLGSARLALASGGEVVVDPATLRPPVQA